MIAIVWGQPACSYCDLAIKLLLSKGYVVNKKTVGAGYTKEDLIKAVPGARSVPQIFLDGKHIGGYLELCELLAHD